MEIWTLSRCTEVSSPMLCEVQGIVSSADEKFSGQKDCEEGIVFGWDTAREVWLPLFGNLMRRGGGWIEGGYIVSLNV